ncbi:MAG: NAD(P)/FAD-dependent oxidoreductase [Myxococcales bacterium]|nr:NAD(P)/FAD-dependent oxidoreductase [Myxococcales bacterium]
MAQGSTYDAIILGSSVNDLVCAAYLAKAGQRVLVLEPRAEVGGPAALTPVHEGFRAAMAPADAGWLPEKVVKDLDLAAHGLDASAKPSPFVALDPGGKHLVLSADAAQTRTSIEAHSKADAEKWDAFSGQMDRLAAFLESLYEASAVELMNPGPSDLMALAGHGLRLRRMGKVDMVELLRVLPMSLADLLDDWFESDLLKGAVASTGVRNIFQGPKSAGTGFTLLHHLAGRSRGAFGERVFPTGEEKHVVVVLQAALKKLGVEVRTRASAKVRVENGRAVGVTLDGGETLDARLVASGADAKRAFLEHVDPWHFEPEFVRMVQHVKLRGVRAFVAFAVDELPAFTGVTEEQLRGTIVMAPSMNYLEKAFDCAKHGDLAERPFLEITVPSLHDASLAPKGKHVVHVAMQYAPYHLRKRAWNDATRAALTDNVIAAIEHMAPGFKSKVLGSKLVTPVDLEREYGLTEGNLYGGELTLDQILFMRPVPGWSHHKTPLEGYFVSGYATHPGGAVLGLGGFHAASAMLRIR